MEKSPRNSTFLPCPVMSTPSDTALYTSPDPEPTRTNLAYNTIKRQLLAGEFALSARLGEERLAGELGVSRTPIREAVSRLHAEGLLEHHPDGGYTPAVPNLDEIVELYEVRSILENAAIRRPGHDPAALRSLRDDWQALAEDADAATPDPGFVLVDEDFHFRLAAASGNRSLANTLAVINERIRIVRMHDFLTSERIHATIEQHLGILAALLANEVDLAQRNLVEHLAESADVVQERAATAIARMLTRRRDTQ